MAANSINTMAANAVSTTNSLCPDWIYSNSSNVHVANDIGWFKSYHPFSSHLSSTYAVGAPYPVLDIGIVELAVKATPWASTVYGKSTIELHNVLHVPYYPCNVLGRPLASVYQIVEGSSASCGSLELSGKQVAYFQPGPPTYPSLAVLPPAGMHFGQSMFANGAAWVVSCLWPNEERARWQSIQAHRELQHAPPPPPSPPPSPPSYEDLYPSTEIEGVRNDWESEIRASAPRAQFF